MHELSRELKSMNTQNADLALITAAYPIFGASIKRLWGSKGFITYMKELIATVESGASGVIAPGVCSALLRISKLHDREFPHLLPNAKDSPAYQLINFSFPVIGAKLTAYWGTKAFGPYMTELLQDNRSEHRRGFPFEVLMALHAIAEKHNQDYANLFPQIDLWTQFAH